MNEPLFQWTAPAKICYAALRNLTKSAKPLFQWTAPAKVCHATPRNPAALKRKNEAEPLQHFASKKRRMWNYATFQGGMEVVCAIRWRWSAWMQGWQWDWQLGMPQAFLYCYCWFSLWISSSVEYDECASAQGSQVTKETKDLALDNAKKPRDLAPSYQAIKCLGRSTSFVFKGQIDLVQM